MCNGSRAQRPSISNSWRPTGAILGTAFISALCDVLGDRGSIVVYSQQFESQRLLDLASWLPEFSGRIKKIQRRLWDLLPIVRDHVYHPAFGWLVLAEIGAPGAGA